MADKITIFLGLMVLVVAIVLPPIGLGINLIHYTSKQVTPVSLENIKAPAVALNNTLSGVNGTVSVALPAALVREGYPSYILVTNQYFKEHWKDSISKWGNQTAVFDMRNPSDPVLVNPALLSAGYILGQSYFLNQTSGAITSVSNDTSALELSALIRTGADTLQVYYLKASLLVVAIVTLVIGAAFMGRSKKQEQKLAPTELEGW